LNKKILLVDDDEVMLTMLERSLADTGFSLAKASNGKDAVFLAKDWHPDLIVLDVMMPEMDGSEAADSLKKDPATKDIPVIFLTSLLSKAEEKQVTVSTGQTYLAKPLDREKLLSEINRKLS